MVHSGTVCLLRSTARITLAVVAALTLLQPLRVQAQQSPLPENRDAADPLDPTDPNNLRPAGPDSLLSIPGGQRLMSEASTAISDQNYVLAAQKLQESRQVFNQLSNFYQQLATAFSGIDNRLADTNRTKALETAQMRDEATYRLALVHRAQNKPELAVPLLIQIIRSQQPTRDLGKKAYQQLLELGFVDVPYPRPARDAQPSSSTK
ncbi:hypothetical protein PN499_28850 [Kamptonema animale CS-326]|jgi:hypothetical protein|uniref:hypothetical protein n=1 Tax=Kamptonema TaxID=1501433 RepID=UPI0001DAC35B|nr:MULTISPECIES: hypothetical protein [Kamptonema]MDB9515214.1 hypothetical protein [Kamptonema animale CS-326]CBN53674.1 conserved exported hypothetical protein [Kamptonema sp. PCC 6506]